MEATGNQVEAWHLLLLHKVPETSGEDGESKILWALEPVTLLMNELIWLWESFRPTPRMYFLGHGESRVGLDTGQGIRNLTISKRYF